jgi:hypothetical protein
VEACEWGRETRRTHFLERRPCGAGLRCLGCSMEIRRPEEVYYKLFPFLFLDVVVIIITTGSSSSPSEV